MRDPVTLYYSWDKNKTDNGFILIRLLVIVLSIKHLRNRQQNNIRTYTNTL